MNYSDPGYSNFIQSKILLPKMLLPSSKLPPIYNSQNPKQKIITTTHPKLTTTTGTGSNFFDNKYNNNNKNTQLLLDRVYRGPGHGLEMIEPKIISSTPTTIPIHNVYRNVSRRRQNPTPPPKKIPPVTFKEMILAAFVGLNPKCLRGVHFPELVGYIRSNFQLSSNTNQSLELHVNKTLNMLILKGHVIQSYGMKQMEGIYTLINHEKSGLNLTLTGQSVPELNKDIRTGHALPGSNSHFCRTMNTGGNNMVNMNVRKIGTKKPNSIPFRRDQSTGLSRLARPNYKTTDPMITKSFGARGGLTLKKDVTQRPNTPNSGSTPHYGSTPRYNDYNQPQWNHNERTDESNSPKFSKQMFVPNVSSDPTNARKTSLDLQMDLENIGKSIDTFCEFNFMDDNDQDENKTKVNKKQIVNQIIEDMKKASISKRINTSTHKMKYGKK